MALRQALIRSGGVRVTSLALASQHAPRVGMRYSSTAPATIADGSFWRSLVPKPLRKENRQLRAKKGKQWNPATFFIVMFLLIGSMSIQMIALRNSFTRYMRQSDNTIAKLREVVERIQNGEDVDVEAMLGTGEAKKEADWEEMLRAIERDDVARKAQKQEKAKRSEPVPPPLTPQVEEQEPAPKPKAKGTLGNFF